MTHLTTPALAGVLLVMLSGCASVPLEQARQAFHQGDYQQAIDTLSSEDIRSKDKLLALMEKGLIQHQAGNYDDSSKTFLEASALLESSDYVSISEQGSALLINDATTTYRGEYAERLWIHTYQMMNFLLLGNTEGAAVEARQALTLFSEHDKTLQQDFFTRALMGVSFDSVGLPNDAYIEYRKLAELLPSAEPLAPILHQRARQLGFGDDASRYAKLIPPGLSSKKSSSRDNNSELVLFVAQGNIPEKRTGDLFVYPDIRISFPVYEADSFHSPTLNIRADGDSVDASVITTDLGGVARKSLAARGKSIAARQVGRAVAKNALVNAAEEQSEAGAAVLNVLLFVLEKADTRGWETLPASLSLIRIPLPAGAHEIAVSTGNQTAGTGPLIPPASVSFDIKAGQTLYRKIRL